MTAPIHPVLSPIQAIWRPVVNPHLKEAFNPSDYDLAKKLSELGTLSERRPQPAQRPTTVPAIGTDPLVALLFDARAQAKAIAASLSMHLPTEWRVKVFHQLDELLEAAEWDKDAGLLDARTMRTFLRFVIFFDIRAFPSLGLSPAGNMIAAWRRDTRRLTMEFLPADLCRLAISHFTGNNPSIFTFSGKVTDAGAYLRREAFPLG